MGKSLKKILLNTGIGLGATLFSILPNVSPGQTSPKTNYTPEITLNTDGSQDWDGKTRHWHVTPENDTLVSYLNPEQANEFDKKMEKNAKGTDELVYDPEHPMFGLVSYVPAHDTAYQTNTDWYGSGDVDGDGEITWDDYFSTVSGTNPFYDGTHRGDTDLDGVSGTASDKQIIYEYLMGNRTHINKWELETEPEQTSHLEKALAIDFTSEVSSGSSGWNCGNYRAQLFVNFNGAYDIENSNFAEPNGTNLETDITHNGIFRIPLRYIDTKTGSGTSHAINSVYLGNPENQNATEFDSRIFIEPQTDEFQEIGDYSLNTYAKEKWYGYTYNNLFEEWQYGTRNLIDYDISIGNAVIDFVNPNLMESWNPFLKVEQPSDQEREFPADTSVITNGAPANLYDGTRSSYSDESSQTSNGTCSDVNYSVSRAWDLWAGAYNSGNTPIGSHVQNIHVEDTTPPEVATMPADTSITKYDSMHPDDLGWPTWTDNSTLPLADSSYYDELISGDDPIQNWARYFTGTDVCGNERVSEAQYINVDLLEGIEKKVKGDDAYISPNPVLNEFVLHYNKPGNVKVGLYDIQGKLLEEKLYSNLPAGTDIPYNVRDLSNGLYIMKIQGEDGSFETEKIVKQ